MAEPKILVIDLDLFFEQFKKYVKDKNQTDYDSLKNDFNHGDYSDWDTITGQLAIKMIKLIKQYFQVKVGFHPWCVPYCSGGVLLMLAPDKMTLEDVAQKLTIDTNECIMTPDQVESTLMSLYV